MSKKDDEYVGKHRVEPNSKESQRLGKERVDRRIKGGAAPPGKHERDKGNGKAK